MSLNKINNNIKIVLIIAELVQLSEVIQQIRIICE